LKIHFDFIVCFYDYIVKLLEAQSSSLKLNQAASQIIEGDYENYDEVLELSFKMNKDVADIMNYRKLLSAFANVYKDYVN
jgi:hypothetical protein